MEKYLVTGMSCAACSARVEKAVSKVDGVTSCSVSLLTNSMGVEGTADPAAVIQAVEEAGYGASLQDGSSAAAAGRKTSSQVLAQEEEMLKDRETPRLRRRLIWSVAVLLVLMYLSMGYTMASFPVPAFLEGNPTAVAVTEMLLAIIIMIINGKFFTSGYRTLFQGAPNMDTLVALGSTASFGYSLAELYIMLSALNAGNQDVVLSYSMNLYFEAAAMIPTLITVGKLLEAKSKGKTTDALKSLMKLAPKTATLVRDGKEVEVPIDEVRIDDIFVVHPGESIPVDGVILEGTAAVNEAALTGESLPVDKAVGDEVSAATIDASGYIRCRAVRVGEDTTLSQIIQMVSDAAATKAPLARIADRVSGIFVPTVIGLAVLTFIGWMIAGKDVGFSIARAISVLVISCPCALGLATPVAIMVGTGKGAENGILIKSGEALETAHNLDMVVLDKTGTITEGKPRVTDVILLCGSADETNPDFAALLTAAAGLEHGSSHPLAGAVMEYTAEKQIDIQKMDSFVTLFGKGVQAEQNGSTFYAGNVTLMEEAGIYVAAVSGELDKLADAGKTPLLFAKDKELLGIIAVADREKETSRQAIAEFKKLGINVVMLTGDNQRTAEAIQKRMDIPQVIAGVLPEGKEKVIASLQAEGHRVAMIGDGINDAPALARADVGIAIGAGTDVAIESADIVLMKSDLLDAVDAVRLSKDVIKKIKEGLFWAFFYNVVCIPVAAGALMHWGIHLNPMFGAAAMSLSSVSVVTNALRLKGFKPTVAVKSKAATEAGIVQLKSLGMVPVNAGKDNKNISITGGSTMEKVLKVEGMTCAHCQKHVTNALAKLDGVTSVDVSLEAKTATVKADRDIPVAEFEKAITDAGYELVK